ncbi:alpha-L-rhamnosidase [Lacisediminihabitans changchengi]|uniref:alpha-L-rhamnosidase n=1 Tax=Lacisediminihabitans changchengi TaxID=2787634 RepID=A0A934SI57_9MICO|nr:alpha-L-rhamnosidase [Lacisediminihabitans changchengi]MBK4347107.1 family 78 glycoside hydrolase catalytic domain [Lacisediminihabitans changchengi]
MSVTVATPTFEHHDLALGIGEVRPRISWTITAEPGWTQRAYEIETRRAGIAHESGRIESSEQILVPWADDDLDSRAAATVRVRVWGQDDAVSDWSSPSEVEIGLLHAEDWTAVGIGAGWHEDTEKDNPPPLLRGLFEVDGPVASARLYVTAHGLAEVEINGRRAGDQALLPGWTVYQSRLRVITIDVTELLVDGANAWGAWMGDGWYRGRFGFYEGGTRNLYGDRLGLLAQLEITYADGRRQTVGTDATWRAALGPITLGSLYDGERFDARRHDPAWSTAAYDASGWAPVAMVEFDLATFTTPDGPPVRCTEELRPKTVTALSGGRMLLDFGQNLVGRLRVTVKGEAGHVVRLLHAEVLQDGELYRRPLRGAAAIDEYTLAGLPDGEVWEPRLTIHGFRYVEVDGWEGRAIEDAVVARVYHSDMRRTGWFETSNPLVNRLHDNIVASMRGNFVDVPTDCPQRDERLGWTGDLQVFAPTASFLYDTSGFLASWLKDLEAEQLPDGTVPWYVPVIPGGDMWTPIRPGAVWGDVAVLTPWVLWSRYADKNVLARQYESARRWVDLVERLSGGAHLWNSGFQLGDWLDPAAPPDDPADAKTDRYLVATAYAAWSARHLAQIAEVLGRAGDAEHYAGLAGEIRRAFVEEYVNADGTLTSDAVTAYSLAIAFGLMPDHMVARAGHRLAALVAESGFTIATGFAGVNVVSDALSMTGHTDIAYGLLLEEECPSWLYAVKMGATTIWERWDSMLPDGSINPGEMTSFNHYALGSVADWMHRRVAGIEALEPGYRVVRFRPEPGGGLTWASARHLSPYGEISISWTHEQAVLTVELVVPIGVTGIVYLPGTEPVTIGAGTHRLHAELEETR